MTGASWRAVARVAVAVLLVLGVASGCTKDHKEVDPATARKDRVEARLAKTFSDRQASCITGRLSPADLRALDRSTTLAGDDASLRSFSDALAVCVAGG